MRVRLTRKLANLINGIDLTKARVGEVIELPDWQAGMLIAEGWAEVVTAGRESQANDRVKKGRSR